MENKALIKCPKCGEPLMKKRENTFYFLSYRNGKSVEVKVDYKHFGGGNISIECWKCGAKIYSLELVEIFNVKNSINKKKKGGSNK